MSELRFTYSQLSTQSVLQLLSDFYKIGEVRRCFYYVLGLHDNYLIDTEDEKFILRIYRNDWRSPDEINFELTVLNFLDGKRAPVSSPILTIENNLYFDLKAPEGKRLAALFPYAKGVSPGNKISLKQCELLGRTVAMTHKYSDSFECGSFNKNLDISYLLDKSISVIESFLTLSDMQYLDSLKQSLKASLPDLPEKEGIYGVCLGDVNPTNFHIDSEEKVTLFDFDQCGYGYRAFEIGKFNSSINPIDNKEGLANRFLCGYQSVRPLSDDELKSIPYFEIISHVWVMAIHAYNANRVGYKRLEKPYWDRRLFIIKELEKRLA